MRTTWFAVIAALAFCGCAASESEERVTFEPDGAADTFGFQYGIYRNFGFGFEPFEPLFLAFHDVTEGLQQGYAGHFDYSYLDSNEEPVLHSGIFQLSTEGDSQKILLEEYDGEVVGRFEWRIEDRTFVLDEYTLDLVNFGFREGVLRECEAFQVLDYIFEESFTPWEYPSVDIEEVDGGYDVSVGCSGFETADGDSIEVSTNDAGDFETRVTTSYGDRIVIQVPNARPYRGRVLHGYGGDEPELVANLVCYPPPAAPEPEEPQVTQFTCTTQRPEQDGETARIRFSVVGLETPDSMELHWPEEVENPISVEPETSFAYTLVGGIADGYLSYTDGKLRLFTDQIGYEFGELVLYENSGFEHGYFKFEMMDPEGTSFYTEISCILE